MERLASRGGRGPSRRISAALAEAASAPRLIDIALGERCRGPMDSRDCRRCGTIRGGGEKSGGEAVEEHAAGDGSVLDGYGEDWGRVNPLIRKGKPGVD